MYIVERLLKNPLNKEYNTIQVWQFQQNHANMILPLKEDNLITIVMLYSTKFWWGKTLGNLANQSYLANVLLLQIYL